MPETPESSSPSTTTPGPTKRLSGKNGKLYVDGKMIGDVSHWELTLREPDDRYRRRKPSDPAG